MSDKDDGDYEVGYGRPPKKTQFKKGKSGNPKGRPRKKQDPGSIFQSVLAEQITYREGDQVQELSASEALLYKQVCKAMLGDQTSFGFVMQLVQRYGLLEKLATQPVLLDVGPEMTEEEWLEAARKQQAASKKACAALNEELGDE